MKEYKIYSNPQGNHEAVKQGWSWPAFFLGFIWAMFKKMWGIGFGVLAAFLLLGFFLGFSGAESSGDALINICSLVAAIIFGMQGNKWRESHLPTRGYDFEGTVSASNPEGAVAMYLRERKAS